MFSTGSALASITSQWPSRGTQGERCKVTTAASNGSKCAFTRRPYPRITISAGLSAVGGFHGMRQHLPPDFFQLYSHVSGIDAFALLMLTLNGIDDPTKLQIGQEQKVPKKAN